MTYPHQFTALRTVEMFEAVAVYRCRKKVSKI